MLGYYEIKSTKRLDGQDQYGNVTDSAFFEGETQSALWRHAPNQDVTPGIKVFGDLTDETSAAGKPWRKFKKAQVPEDWDGETPPEAAPKAFQGGSNGGDGARQGMSINNAAKYVIESAVKDDITLDPQELADEIKRYALEIYKIDLNVTVNEEVEDV